MPQQIPPEVKADYLRALAAAGFTHIDAVSFVSPSAVPQMADSERVLALLEPDSAVEIIAIVVNQQGAERAVRTGAVRTLGFPYSISATFLERNQRQTLQEAQQTLQKICTQASQAGLGVVAYLSMAFGNPYGDPWRQEDVIAACLTLKELGLKQISLADTVGVATPGEIRSLVSAVLASPRNRTGSSLARTSGACCPQGLSGLPGRLPPPGCCPGWARRLSFAQDALVGNVATEAALTELSKLGAKLPPIRPLDELLAMAGVIADRFGAVKAG